MAHNASDEMVVTNRVVKSWAPAMSAWQQYRTSRGKTSGSSQLDSTMDSVGDKIREAHDLFADVLGQPFIRGDHLFESDMEDIEKGLLSQLSLSLRASSGNSSRQSDSSPDHESEITQLAVKAVARTTRILERLASRLGFDVRSSEPSPPGMEASCDESTEIDWCKGALLIQQSSASYSSTLAQPTTKFSSICKVCKFCYLEVSDYRLKAALHTDEDWSALVSCHVLASSSFNDRRAAYRCFGCYVSGVSKILPSAAAMLDHIATCEEFAEKRTVSQMPQRTTATWHRRLPSRSAQSDSDNSTSSTPETNGSHSPAPILSKPRPQAPPPSNQVPLPTRNRPPVPPNEAAHSYPPRTEASYASQSVPGTFPNADPIEQFYQPLAAPPTSNTLQQPLDPFRPSNSTPRKPILASQAQPSEPPPRPSRPPPVSPSRPQRTNMSPTLAEPSSPPLPRLPAQVRQSMEMGATRREAENGLEETNWDVPHAADLIWRNRQGG